MRHLKAGRKLGRNATHRLALMRNLTRALIEHERIITTIEKAKEARRFVEKLVTLAKKNTLHARRLALARLHDQETITKLFDKIAPRFKDRPGGYTRIVKRSNRRLGDAGSSAFLELLKEGETKVRARTPAAPVAPKVTAPEPPQPEASTPAPPSQAPAPEPTDSASASQPSEPGTSQDNS